MSKIQGSMFFFTHLHTSIFQITIISTERFALGKDFGCNAFWKRKGVNFVAIMIIIGWGWAIQLFRPL